jgi:hypothetical protein
MQQLSKAFSRQQSMECSRRSTFQKLFPANNPWNAAAAAPFKSFFPPTVWPLRLLTTGLQRPKEHFLPPR